MFEGLFNFANVSNHLVLIGIYVILALSLNLINGSLGVFSLGHQAFWGMGAYAAGIVVWTRGSLDGSLWVFLLSFAAAMLAAGLLGLLVGAPCLRLRGDYLAIATLGFGEIFIAFVRNSQSWSAFGERGLGGKAGFSIGDGFKGQNDIILTLFHGSTEARSAFYLVFTWLLVAVTFILIRHFVYSGFGRAVLAIRDDQTAAELMGVNLIRHKVLVFVIGALLAGMAGAISANYRSAVSPDEFGMMEGIKILLMIVLGGLGSMSGAVIAVIMLYASEQALGTIELRVPFVAFAGSHFNLTYVPVRDLWQVLFALLLIVLMRTWPRGLTGGREFSREYFRQMLTDLRGIFSYWLEHPLIPLLTILQWGQLLYLLPKSAELSSQTSIRLSIIAGSLIFAVICHYLKQLYKSRHVKPVEVAGGLPA